MYYPDDKDFSIFDAKLTEVLSRASEFEFKMPVENQMYDSLEERISMIQILRDGKEKFYGEVREISETLEKVKSVYCVGELAFLFDSTQPQARYQSITPKQFFIEILNIHNSKVEEKKRFEVGIVTVQDSNNSLYRYTNGEDTLTVIRKKLCEPLGGYLRIRKKDGKRYLDLVSLKDYGVSAEQPIQFGRNLMKYNSKKSGANIATVCVPRGARLDTEVVEGLDAYVDIKSVNAGKDYVINQAAYETYGWIEKVVEWKNVTEPANLLTKAQEWVNNNQYKVLSLDLKAIDLAELNANMSPYEVGDMIHSIAEPFGMDMWFPLMKKVTYINNSITNDVTLSYEEQITYTSQQNNNLQDIGNEIPQRSSWLEAAKVNASELIKSATNGCIVLKMDDKGNPQELLIMDTKDIETAQKVWRWNINGFGYSSTGYNGTYETAITMDGGIVADFIRIGTMLADRIKGGTLTIGGLNNENGVLSIVNAEGEQIGKWDKDGISAKGSLLSDGKTVIGGVEYEQDYEIKGGHGTILLDGKQAYRYGVVGTGSIDKTGIMHASSLSRLLFAFMDNTGAVTDTVYQLNNGYNPNGMTEQNIFNGTARAVKGMNVPYILFMDNGTSTDESKWGKIRGSSTGQLVCESDLFVTGTLYTASGTVSASDKNLKKFIKALDKSQTADFIYSLIPSRYKYRKGKRYHHGFIAQEVKESMQDEDWGLYIETVDENGKAYKALRYEELIADLVATVQSQNDRIKLLEERIRE